MEYQQRTLAEWGRRYGELSAYRCRVPTSSHLTHIYLPSASTIGDVVFARFFRTPAIILNSREMAEELLEKRSAKYSDRPRFILLNEM